MTVGPHGTDADLCGFGIIAAFSAGAFDVHSRVPEWHTAEHVGAICEQSQKLTGAVEALASDASSFKSNAEDLTGRLGEATAV